MSDMMSRIAITIWNNRISPVFESAGRVMVVEMVENREVSRSEWDLPVFRGNDESRGQHVRFLPPQFGGVMVSRKVERLRELNIDLLVCGAISDFAARFVNSAGIEVVGWISGNVEEIVVALEENKIANAGFLMPGCGRRRRGGRDARGRGRLGHGSNY
jgi:predicted Fe-Mo cluster-binding NifX family protein